ncbi:hypothetical protein BO70DRAFT_92035 [Aspergillus heteromorphus CBS 117.55]|uniref:Uncharacterized protein n=1 Tax=Aspergillus heteromorphus CBS 117.55 TaxID=1448321 RepID=A0A317VQH6_9EURO|nr:uncharacterized protein BO70DRAFT_92035 [Aspergillus heteromorphus CBS 117.55]PWY76215.1 hypothetical protein BO70DRAFT_92035 [Aspergillus heteromorphus CBS 117.55]
MRRLKASRSPSPSVTANPGGGTACLTPWYHQSRPLSITLDSVGGLAAWGCSPTPPARACRVQTCRTVEIHSTMCHSVCTESQCVKIGYDPSTGRLVSIAAVFVLGLRLRLGQERNKEKKKLSYIFQNTKEGPKKLPRKFEECRFAPRWNFNFEHRTSNSEQRTARAPGTGTASRTSPTLAASTDEGGFHSARPYTG